MCLKIGNVIDDHESTLEIRTYPHRNRVIELTPNRTEAVGTSTRGSVVQDVEGEGTEVLAELYNTLPLLLEDFDTLDVLEILDEDGDVVEAFVEEGPFVEEREVLEGSRELLLVIVRGA